MMRLFGMSLKSSPSPPSFTQIGPSVKMNPSASFSILASVETIAFRPGSFSTIEPDDGRGGGVAGATGGGAGCEQNNDAKEETSSNPSASRRFMNCSPYAASRLNSQLTILKGNLKLKGE
jgi:hypothetical protein